MYLLLIVLQALCELVNGGGLAPQLEPVRRTPEEPEGSSSREKRRTDPSLCSVFDPAPPVVIPPARHPRLTLPAPPRGATSGPGGSLRCRRYD
jgi:hypothetical protein